MRTRTACGAGLFLQIGSFETHAPFGYAQACAAADDDRPALKRSCSMADSTGIGKVLRDLTQAYLDGLTKIGSAIGDLAKSRMPDAERQMEHWIGVARAAKDGYVAAIDEAFSAWERRVRRTLGRKSATNVISAGSVVGGGM